MPHLLARRHRIAASAWQGIPRVFARTMVVVAGFGNPLLDVTVKISGKALLKKYNLNEDDEKEISAGEMRALLRDVLPLNPTLSPGGAGQNTMRVLQWILMQPNSTIMFGAIGRDVSGRNLKKLVEVAGVQTRYIEHEDESTGTTVALISGANRSLVAYIGAAQKVTTENLQRNDITDLLKTADLVYIEGFFLTDRARVVQYIHEFCCKNKILFAFNLSAVYMAQAYTADVLHFAKMCDILIGNQKEYNALISAAGLPFDAQAFALDLTKNYSNVKGTKYGKIVIMTNGSKSAICVHSNGKVEEIAVPKIDASQIGDTTGAGDAFAAGFLGGFFAAKPPVTCLKWGCWVAQQIIQQVGCTIPKYPAGDVLKTIE